MTIHHHAGVIALGLLNDSNDTVLRLLAAAIGSAASERSNHEDTVERLREELATARATADRQAQDGVHRGVAEQNLRAEVDKLRAAVLSEQQKVRSWQRSAEQSNEQLAVVESEVAELRARPVLTEAAVRLAITSKRTREEGPRIGTPATIYAQLTEGGAVTLPAQDRGKDLARAYVDEHTKIAALVKAGDFSWHPSGYKGTWHSEVGAMMQEVAMSRALASLGAPATA